MKKIPLSVLSTKRISALKRVSCYTNIMYVMNIMNIIPLCNYYVILLCKIIEKIKKHGAVFQKELPRNGLEQKFQKVLGKKLWKKEFSNFWKRMIQCWNFISQHFPRNCYWKHLRIAVLKRRDTSSNQITQTPELRNCLSKCLLLPLNKFHTFLTSLLHFQYFLAAKGMWLNRNNKLDTKVTAHKLRICETLITSFISYMPLMDVQLTSYGNWGNVPKSTYSVTNFTKFPEKQ